MSFVNHKKVDVHLGSPALKERGLKPFGRDIQKFIITIGRIVQCDIYLIIAHARIDRKSFDSILIEILHLIFNEGDKRRDNQTYSLSCQSRHLKTD